MGRPVPVERTSPSHPRPAASMRRQATEGGVFVVLAGFIVSIVRWQAPDVPPAVTDYGSALLVAVGGLLASYGRDRGWW